MKKLTLFAMFMMLAIGLVACQAESEPAVAVIPTVAEVVAEPAGESLAEATEAPAAPRPAATELPDPAKIEPTATIPETSATEVPTEEAIEPLAETGFGMVEGTFYRGLSTAPVRLIDYSDFL